MVDADGTEKDVVAPPALFVVKVVSVLPAAVRVTDVFGGKPAMVPVTVAPAVMFEGLIDAVGVTF